MSVLLCDVLEKRNNQEIIINDEKTGLSQTGSANPNQVITFTFICSHKRLDSSYECYNEYVSEFALIYPNLWQH